MVAAAENNNKNTFISPRNLVDLGLVLLRAELTATRLVWTNPITDWTGRVNDTVNAKVPGRTSARYFSGDGTKAWRPNQDIGPDSNVLNPQNPETRAFGLRPAIVTDTLTETQLSFTIDEVVYNAIGVTDEQMTLDITSFGQQVVAPQTRAMAEHMDAKVVGLMIDGTKYGTDNKLTTTTKAVNAATNPGTLDKQAQELLDRILKARQVLNQKFVPLADRTLVISPDLEYVLLSNSQFRASSLTTEERAASVLGEATIGRLFGMDVVLLQTLPANTAIVFHRSAFFLTTIAPKVPAQAPFGEVGTYDGVALRWIQDYDANHMEDRSVFTLYAGGSHVLDGGSYGVTADNNKNVRAVLIDTSSFSVTT
jgi:hypothetical protein